MKNINILPIVDDEDKKEDNPKIKKTDLNKRKNKVQNISNVVVKKPWTRWIIILVTSIIFITIIWALFFRSTSQNVSMNKIESDLIAFAAGSKGNDKHIHSLFENEKAEDFRNQTMSLYYKSSTDETKNLTEWSIPHLSISESVIGQKAYFRNVSFVENANLNWEVSLEYINNKGELVSENSIFPRSGEKVSSEGSYTLITILKNIASSNINVQSKENNLTITNSNGTYIGHRSTSNPDFSNSLQIIPPGNGFEIFSTILSFLPLLLFIFIGYIIYRSMKKGRGGAFGLPSQKAIKPVISKTLFSDIAGYVEEKFELEEIIDFLKRPKVYTSAGVRTPKGVLLTGPPGTGKTLLARAVAGESNVPFLSINGSEFVELFVGQGAQRVRNIFSTARKHSPCILFIDEIDTVGRVRGIGLGGGNDEREQTLNQLLVELDGFTKESTVVVIAATNRAEVLDKALLRPGRIDRTIDFHSPNNEERYEILKLHSKNKNISPKLNLNEIAERTPGFTGAQLENILNEGALLAIRENSKVIELEHIDEAIDRAIGGLAKKSKKYIDHEKRLVSYHESGHALAGLVLDGADRVQKITIIPRGKAGGYTLTTPKEEKYFTTKKEIIERIIGFLAGRAAEEVIFGKEHVTTGAHNDIEQATQLSKAMVTELGMCPDVGIVKYQNDPHNPNSSGLEVSELLSSKIDNAVKAIIDDGYKKALNIIVKYRKMLELLATALMKKEIINASEIEYIWKNKKHPKSVSNYIKILENKKDNEINLDKLKNKTTTKKTDKIIIKPEK